LAVSILLRTITPEALPPMATLTPICSLTTKFNFSFSGQHNHHANNLNFTTPNLKRTSLRKVIRLVSAANQNQSSPGLYSAKIFDLTASNVDLVLEDVRPYLISDGGNVDVVSVENGVVSLKLQGACESCPSSTTTMKMGIERVLKEKFGDSIKDIVQVYDDDQARETTVEVTNFHFSILNLGC
jgi:Fe-S cluster biogenesis protein NfuA